MNQEPLAISSSNDYEANLGSSPSMPDQEAARSPDPGTDSPCVPGSPETADLNERDPCDGSRYQQPLSNEGANTSPPGQFVKDGDAFAKLALIKRSRGRNRKRLQLEAQFGKSPLYFELKDGFLRVYLDRDLASAAGIFPGDKIDICGDSGIIDRFGISKKHHGWQIKKLSEHSDLLYLNAKIATPYYRIFQSFVFDADGAAIPIKVKVTEEDGGTFIDFTMPNIIPPADLQGHPLILTRAYRDTVLNLDQSLAAEAAIRPGNPLKLGYDAGQYPEKLLIFRWSEQVSSEECILVNDCWIHRRLCLFDFGLRLFPKGSIHLTPSVQVGDYNLSPERPPIKVLVVTVDPPEGTFWADIGRSLSKPFYHGSLTVEETKPLDAHEEKTTAGSDDLSEPRSPGGDAGGESHSDPDNGLVETFVDGSEGLITFPFESSER